MWLKPRNLLDVVEIVLEVQEVRDDSLPLRSAKLETLLLDQTVTNTAYPIFYTFWRNDF